MITEEKILNEICLCAEIFVQSSDDDRVGKYKFDVDELVDFLTSFGHGLVTQLIQDKKLYVNPMFESVFCPGCGNPYPKGTTDCNYCKGREQLERHRLENADAVDNFSSAPSNKGTVSK